MRKNPGYRLSITGHTDFIGSDRYNQGLGERRANAVRRFLEGMGVSSGQLRVETRGESEPKVQSRRRGFARTDEARWVNRRVFLSLQDASGKVIGDSDACNTPEIMDCCKEIMSRLDKMYNNWDPILQGLAERFKSLMDEHKQLMDDHRKLLAEHGQRKVEHEGLKGDISQRPTTPQVTEIVNTEIEKARMPRFNILNLNAGADQNGDLTYTGRGRLFMPFKEQFALQFQGEYMGFRDRKEGQFDAGLVNRFARRAQAGLFMSLKHVTLSQQTVRDPFGGTTITGLLPRSITQFSPGEAPSGSGLLGQGSVTLDYLFSRGRLGIFGAKGFRNSDVLSARSIGRNIQDEYYLSAVDQVGLSATVGLAGDVYAEGNIGYLKSRANADRPGGTLRFVFPLSDRFAFTLEGGMNETLLSRDQNGRVVAGFQMGNFMRPKDYMTEYNGVLHATPADIPRVRYEVLTRRVRTGNDGPVADAGPDQIGIEAGQVTLNGSGSFDPDGDPITFQWAQIAGPPVSISGMNSAIATFTAAEGQTYAFRLTVRDDRGAQGIARTSVTTTAPEQVKILRFQASPAVIRAGQTSTVDWQVLNADSVTIEGIGTVDPRNGTRVVTPTRTMQYRLIARNRVSEATATTTVTVELEPEAAFLACQVSPMNIIAGESATIFYSTLNATEVTISGIGAVDRSGNRIVTPEQTTTYTLTARNARGPVTCTLTVQVTPGEVPRVLNFTANPPSIQRGQASTLRWSVENAQSVTITELGTVSTNGSGDVRPAQTTTYTLTATNRFGQVTATTTVTVTDPPGPPPVQDPTITACTASPATSPRPGDPVVLRYTATNATSVAITGVASASVSGPVTVNPLVNTTYTITATGANNRTATCTVAVTVTPAPPPVAIITGPSVVETINRLLTLDGSQSTNPAGGALTYIWEPLSTGAAVLDQGQQQTRVQIGGLFGDYIFRLTVRNALGQQDSTTVTVRFRSTTVF